MGIALPTRNSATALWQDPAKQAATDRAAGSILAASDILMAMRDFATALDQGYSHRFAFFGLSCGLQVVLSKDDGCPTFVLGLPAGRCAAQQAKPPGETACSTNTEETRPRMAPPHKRIRVVRSIL